MRNKNGVSLIELVIGIFIFGLISTAAFFIFSYGMKVSVYNTTRAQIQHNARLAMERIVSEAKNAVVLPSYPGFSPEVAPSSVFAPAITVERTRNLFCFSQPQPVASNGNYAVGFDFGDITKYRLVSYYIENPPQYSGSSDEPKGKKATDIASNKKTSLKRCAVNIGNPFPILSLKGGSNIWEIQSDKYRISEQNDPNAAPVALNNSAGEAIIEMPYARDYIVFKVSHEPDPDYYKIKQTQFNGLNYGVPLDATNVRDPLLYKVELIVVQYPQGNESYVPQEFRLDSMVQIKSSY